ncbi:MAG: hypothetical protein GEU78_16045 [Actinobacteria bacterium]|nr:hypothetical protein [Actinomycetota bacterium]
MNPTRRLGVVTVLLGLLIVALTSLALILVPLNGDDLSTSDTTGSAILALSFGIAGLLILRRRPTNVIGWIMVISGLFNSVNALSAEYPRYVLVVNPEASLPLGGLLAWVGTWVWVIGAAGFPLIVWLFPTGHPPTPRWAWLRWPILIGAGCAILPMALAAWEVRESAVLAGLLPDQTVEGISATLATTGTVVLGLSLVVALASAVVRYRHTGDDERHQLRWFASAAALTLVVLVTASPGTPLTLAEPWGELFSSLAVLALPSIPAAITIAILRYRLYEIDRLVSRTVSYTVIAAVLALVYSGVVVGIQTLLPASDALAVAASTLTAVALFSPLRRRVQHWVDRRFNRRRYDAEQIVEAFASRLRDEVDPDTLTADLHTVVTQALEPVSTAVWLKDGS